MIKNKTYNRKKIVTVFFLCFAVFAALMGSLFFLLFFQTDY